MINRANWLNVREYLKHRQEVDQISANSQRLEKSWLRHLLEWADENPFEKAPRIRPIFPEYILVNRRDSKKETLSPVYVRHVIRASYNFFQWLRTHHRGFRDIDQVYLETLRPIRRPEQPKERKAISLEEVQALARAPVFSLRDRRIQAAACFWFLSGIRVGAFVTLPAKAVDLHTRTVKQWPSLGVHTKFGKHETTALLDTPDTQELFKIVKNWDSYIRNLLPPDGLWFAPGSPETGEIDPAITVAGKNSDRRARKDLKEWCNKVDVPYFNPHAFRHGHAVYALKLAKNIAQLKAVSQNLMHANISTTDGIYGVLSETDVREQIGSLGKKVAKGDNEDIATLIELVKQLENRLKD